MTSITPDARLPWSRPVLILAAALAAVSIGTAIFRPEPEPPAVPSSPTQGPSLEEIVKRLEGRLKQDPNSAEGWRLLGWAYGQTGRDRDSVTAYRRSTELDPNNADTWSALGEALHDERQAMTPDAVTAFEKALALKPQDPRARFFIGLAKAEKGDARTAIDDWFALLKDSPADAPWTPSIRQKIEQVAQAGGRPSRPALWPYCRADTGCGGHGPGGARRDGPPDGRFARGEA